MDKKCCKCKKMKYDFDFTKNKSTKDGLARRCKSCHAEFYERKIGRPVRKVDPRRTKGDCVYVFSKDGETIYVGRTRFWKTRKSTHKRKTEWISEVTSCMVCWTSSEVDMGMLEIYLINKLQPIYNKDRFDGECGFTIDFEPEWELIDF